MPSLATKMSWRQSRVAYVTLELPPQTLNPTNLRTPSRIFRATALWTVSFTLKIQDIVDPAATILRSTAARKVGSNSYQAPCVYSALSVRFLSILTDGRL